METLHFKLTLSDESKYYDLQNYLKDAGYFVELETIPPTDEEMGGKTVALILMTGLMFEPVQAGIHHFEETHRVQVHIELIEPKKPEDEGNLLPYVKITEQPLKK